MLGAAGALQSGRGFEGLVDSSASDSSDAARLRRAALTLLLAGAASPALAQDLAQDFASSPEDAFQAAETIAACASALAAVLGLWALRLRSRLRRATDSAEADRLSEARASEALEALTLARADGALIWRGDELAGAVGFAEAAARRLAGERGVNAWRLAAESVAAPLAAGALASAMRRLCERGSPFDFDVICVDGRLRRVEGRTVGGRAVVRLLDETEARRELAAAATQAAADARERTRLQTALDLAPLLAWRRDRAGRLTWANMAYARAVEAETPAAAVAAEVELLSGEKSGTAALARLARETGRPQRGRRKIALGGALRSLELLETPTEEGSIGFAQDLTREAEAESALRRHEEATEQTLDAIRVGVAFFDREERLNFCNQAMARLWSVGDAEIDRRPTLAEVFDMLRARRRLPEERDFGGWRAEQLRQIRGLAAQQNFDSTWHRPDGRAIHVSWSAHPLGGVLAVFEDVTEAFALRSQYKAARSTQKTMLSYLREGVALFGADGALQTANQAFAEIWGLPDFGGARPHVAEIARLCSSLYDDPHLWEGVVAQVAGAGETRRFWRRNLRRADGSVVQMAAAPLPDGATLLTTLLETSEPPAAGEAELGEGGLGPALKPRFLQAIGSAGQDLRNSINVISGFANALEQGERGPLAGAQTEAARHIRVAAQELRQWVDELIDYARLVSEEERLDLVETNVASTLKPILGWLGQQADARGVALTADLPDLGAAQIDPQRLGHAVYNTVSALIRHARPDQPIAVEGESDAQEIRLRARGLGLTLPSELSEALAAPRDQEDWPEMSLPGMRLALARRILRRHGGELELREAPGQGVEALMRLARSRKPQAAPKKRKASASPR